MKSTETRDPDAVPLDLSVRSYKYLIASILCSQLATSLMISSAILRPYNKNGMLTLWTWNCGTAIAAAACHIGSYVLVLYTCCKALRLNNARVLARAWGQYTTL